MKFLLILNIIILTACSASNKKNEHASVIVMENLKIQPESSNTEHYVHKCPNFKISEEFQKFSCH